MQQTVTDWQTRFADKITTAEQAIRAIPRGRRILVGSGAAEPSDLVNASTSSSTQSGVWSSNCRIPSSPVTASTTS